MTITDEGTATTAAIRSHRDWRAAAGLLEVRWALLATALFALGAVGQVLGAPAAVWWTLYLACYAAGGWEPAWAGLQAVRDRKLDVDLLMIVAAVAAAAIGQVFDGALLIVIFATSGALESFMTHRTADSVRALLDLAPGRATREVDIDTDVSGLEVVAVSELVVGDVVLVRPGERVGADGTVIDGASEIDQSTITGEPLPRFVTEGHEVFAGTFNGTGSLRVRVIRPAAEFVVSRIAGLVEHAASTKARTQLFVEKVESRYSILVVIATLLLVALPLLTGAEFTPTLLRAMTFMIVASPCAVVLATMPPLLSAIANAGRHGVLVKSAVAMEKLARTTLVAFDKTGTLTEGTPRVVAVTPIPSADIPVDSQATAAHQDDADTMLALAAAVERDSEHPVGRAVMSAAREHGLTVPAATGFRSTPGEGVTAVVNGHRLRVGSPALLARASKQPHDEPSTAASRLVRDAEEEGHTAVVVLVDDVAAAVIALADRARPEARETVAALAALTGHTPILLTGDNHRAAARLAAEVGITDVRASLLPEGKLDAVHALEAAGHRVMLVGDGVNDAPAMAAAHLGVALGHRGSDLALQTADAVIVRDDLATLPALVELSRRAGQVARGNLGFAVAVICALITWDMIGSLPLPLGVAGHEGSTVMVGLNGLRLLRASTWRRTNG